MKILALSDEPDKYLWDYYEKDKVRGYDAIIACGDLPARYLSVLATFADCPLFFVPGNHDDYSENEPEGCINIDGKIINHKGCRIMGLGGSKRYKPGPNQYSEREMSQRVIKLIPGFIKYGGVDILVTHSPAFGIGDDAESYAHKGFKVFNKVIERFSPKLHLHGHVHLNYGMKQRVLTHNDTLVINAYQKTEVEI